MFKSKLWILTLFLYASSYAQNHQFDDLLKEIEQNNPRLLALKEANKQQLLTLKANHTWKNPEIQAFYLPFGNHTGGDYREIQLSQQIDLPQVSIQKKRLQNQWSNVLNVNYQQERQTVLLETQQLYIEWLHFSKQIDRYTQREKQSNQILKAVQEAFKEGDASILEVQKAKLLWIKSSNRLDELELSQKYIQNQLKVLNGNQPIELTKLIEFSPIQDLKLETLWIEKQSKDPELLYLKHQTSKVNQELKLQKSKRLPDLTLGINQQETDRISYFGVMAGVSIPLWKNSKLIKTKTSAVAKQDLESQFVKQQVEVEFTQAFQTVQTLSNKYSLYAETFSQIKSENLLLESYNLGELSLSEYVLELQFYQTAFDNFLELEKDLWLVQIQLLKHRL